MNRIAAASAALLASTALAQAGGLDRNQLGTGVLFEEGTEPPFDNPYRDHEEPGIYVDLLDGTPLFSSTDKFISSS